MRPFDQFDCILKWRMYDDDSALDYDVYFNSTVLLNDYMSLFFFLANAVDNITVEWNTDPQLSSPGWAQLVYENVSSSNDLNQFNVILPSSILMQGNKNVS